jgi:hypothetical protein
MAKTCERPSMVILRFAAFATPSDAAAMKRLHFFWLAPSSSGVPRLGYRITAIFWAGSLQSHTELVLRGISGIGVALRVGSIGSRQFGCAGLLALQTMVTSRQPRPRRGRPQVGAASKMSHATA